MNGFSGSERAVIRHGSTGQQASFYGNLHYVQLLRFQVLGSAKLKHGQLRVAATPFSP